MARFETKIPPPIIWIIAAALTWIVDRVDLDGSPLAGTASEWLGVLLALAGIALAISGLREFTRARTTSDPHRIDEVSTLVTTGVYRFTRNPMYVGLTLLSIGWALRLGTAAGMAVGTGFLILALTLLQIRPEERALRNSFGAEYDEYTAAVRRWI